MTIHRMAPPAISLVTILENGIYLADINRCIGKAPIGDIVTAMKISLQESIDAHGEKWNREITNEEIEQIQLGMTFWKDDDRNEIWGMLDEKRRLNLIRPIRP